MSYWKLSVEGFGKIKKAEIELAPMTLFVGDNNSGKSYLLSLAWAMYQLSDELFQPHVVWEMQSRELDYMKTIFLEAFRQAEDGQTAVIRLEDILSQLQAVTNQILQSAKDGLVKRLFNSDCVSIQKLCLRMPEDLSGSVNITLQPEPEIFYKIRMRGYRIRFRGKQTYERMTYVSIGRIIVNLFLDNSMRESFIYMPAARTGFMLAKDIINKYARKRAYDIELVSEEQSEVQPFSRPILDFLDVMNDLSPEQGGREAYRLVADFIRQQMVQGSVEISGLPGHELSYVPQGDSRKYPFRATSAVVTELAPLLLLLSHKQNIAGIFYEEPEMCLHPALQKRMGQVLARMVNTGIRVTATTHCDIILQHINNMIRLNHRNKNPKDYGYDCSDLVKGEQVRVYQLTNREDGTTEVTGLACGENGFAVPTFNEALDEIMEDAIQIQSQE